jgi:TfoX/Sxy family transcriptional regulator of competence genes
VAYDKQLADRVHAMLDGVSGVTAKPLFGGYGLFRDGVMFAGVWRAAVMVKLRDGTADALLEPHTSGFDPMNTGKPMTGWVVVDSPGIATDEQLKDWLDRALAAIPVTANRRRQPPGGAKNRKK